MPVFEILLVAPERPLRSTSAFCFSMNLWRQGFHFRGATRVQVILRDNNIEQALRVLKKRMQREGVFKEMRRHRFYEKPSERATREKAEAARRSRKQARRQAIRDGLIAAPIKKPPLAGKRGTTSRVNAAGTPQG
jgi:small subunit ribosomal protein S21